MPSYNMFLMELNTKQTSGTLRAKRAHAFFKSLSGRPRESQTEPLCSREAFEKQIFFLFSLLLLRLPLTKVGFLSELPAKPLHGLSQDGLGLGVARPLLLAPHTGHGVHHAHLGSGGCKKKRPLNHRTKAGRPVKPHVLKYTVTYNTGAGTPAI